MSVSILSSEPKPLDDYRALRRWAVETLAKYIVSLSIGGQPLTPDKTYLVATTDFDAAGHVRAFKDATRVKHTSVGRHIYDIVLLHMYDERTVAPTTEGRITKVSK